MFYIIIRLLFSDPSKIAQVFPLFYLLLLLFFAHLMFCHSKNVSQNKSKNFMLCILFYVSIDSIDGHSNIFIFLVEMTIFFF